MATIYTPNSEPMKEIDRLINEAKMGSTGSLRTYYNTYYNEINRINNEVANANSDLDSYPEKQRKYLDAERGII
ncbi:hypothetical protein [Chryseobacterium wanjuense]